MNARALDPDRRWALHSGSCVDPASGLWSLPANSVDHVITDPPYSEHTHAAGRRGALKGETGKAAISRSRDLGFEALTQELQMDVAKHLARVALRWVLVFTDAEGIHGWKQALVYAGLDYVRCGAWIKRGSCPQFTGDRPATGFEAIVIAHRKGKKRWNGGGRHGLWEVPIVLERGAAGEARVHTTQKPALLMRQLVEDFTDAGDLILDPFAGSGTTGVAALMTGRRFVGWELDPKYAATARERLSPTVDLRAQAAGQLGLFGGGAP